MRTLTIDEIYAVDGGMTAKEAGAMSAGLAATAGLYAAGAAIPSPLSPALGVIAGVTAAASGGYALYAIYFAKE